MLRAELGVRVGLPAAAWMLEVGAFVLRTETELIIKSRRVVPARLQAAGFTFRCEYFSQAIHALERAWSAAAGAGTARGRDDSTRRRLTWWMPG
jgi:hypothetical protein